MRACQSGVRCCRSDFDGRTSRKILGALHLLMRRVNGHVGLVRVVEEREDAVVLFLRERIVFVVVALRALDGDAEDALADGVHAIEHGLHAELLGIDAALLVDHRVAQETGGHVLILGGIRQLVAGNLLDHETGCRAGRGSAR